MFAPAVIAGACYQVTRTATFPPSVAEFLTMCETKAKELTAAARYLTIAHDVRELAEEVQRGISARGAIV